MFSIYKQKQNTAIAALAAGLIFGLSVFFSPNTAPKLILGTLASALSFANPLYSIYLTIIVIPFLSNELMLIFSAVVIASFIFRLILKKENSFVSTPIDMPIIVFVLIEVFATITSVSPFLSARNLVVELLGIAMYFAIVNTIKSKDELDKAIKIFILIAFFMSLYGIYQYFTMDYLNKAWVDVKLNPELKTRVIGTFGNPNIFAEYLEHILPAAIALIFAYGRASKKFIMLVISGAMFICLLMTASRGAWLGFAVGMMLFAALKLARYIPVFIAGVIAGIPFLPGYILQRITTIGSIQDSSNAYRVNIWAGTINMIKDFWVTGVGFGYWAFKNAFYEYTIKGQKTWHSHNMYLQVLAEMGIFGFLTFMWLVILLFKSAMNFILNTKDGYLSYLAAGLLCGMLSIMVHGLAEHILYMPKSVLMFYMFIGFIMAARNIGINLKKQQ